MKLMSSNRRMNAATVALLALAGLGTWQLLPAPAAEAAPSVEHGLTAIQPPVGAPTTFADLIEAVKPAVVNISSSAPATRRAGPDGMRPDRRFPGNPSLDEFFRRFFEPQAGEGAGRQPLDVQSLGSGFIVDAGGLVVTNNHVIEGASEVVVTLNDGTRYPAEVIGSDPQTDLALLEIEAAEPLPHASFGDSQQARAGDWVIAIGNPFGLGGTATSGIVSARGRDIQAGPYDDYLQIDAPINRGNSGGPLFDTSGRVIGVNTAIYSPNGGSVGIGFAIPASQAAPIIDQLRENGEVVRGWLGVQIQQLDDEVAEGLGLDSSDGALVASVVDESPASRAGLEPGDVIVSFEDQTIEDIKDLTRQVAAVAPGEEVELELWRDGNRIRVDVDLGQNPGDGTRLASTGGAGGDEPEARLGLSLSPLTPDTRRHYGLDQELEGALVSQVEPGSPASAKGIRAGDVVLRVGQKAVSSPSAVIEEVERLREDDRPSVVFQIARGDERRFLAVPLA
jgi:serine protease Do